MTKYKNPMLLWRTTEDGLFKQVQFPETVETVEQLRHYVEEECNPGNYTATRRLFEAGVLEQQTTVRKTTYV